MDINHLGIAIISYISGAVAIYAYVNRNRYIDMLLAAIAAFTFGTAILLAGSGILISLARLLLGIATGVMAFAALFLVARVAGNITRAVAQRLRPRRTNNLYELRRRRAKAHPSSGEDHKNRESG